MLSGIRIFVFVERTTGVISISGSRIVAGRLWPPVSVPIRRLTSLFPILDVIIGNTRTLSGNSKVKGRRSDAPMRKSIN